MKAGLLIGHMKRTNESVIIRTAEAFGLNTIFVVGERSREYGISQGADKQVLFIEFPDYPTFLNYLIKNNHSLVCIENIETATKLDTIQKYPINPVFVSGNEGHGVPEILLSNADLVVEIEQGVGYIRCLNTAIAASIVIHDFFRKMVGRNEKRKSI